MNGVSETGWHKNSSQLEMYLTQSPRVMRVQLRGEDKMTWLMFLHGLFYVLTLRMCCYKGKNLN